MRAPSTYFILFIAGIIAIGINSATFTGAQYSIPAANAAPAVSSAILYQVSCKSPRPFTGIDIADSSTGAVLVSWSSSGSASSSGTYYLHGNAGEKFLLSMSDSGDGGLFISVSSGFANLLHITLHYPDGTIQEIAIDPPVVLFNCSLEDMAACTPGGTLYTPYQDCSRTFAGYAELVVTHAGGTWKEFEQNVLQPLKSSAEWNANDVYTFVFRKLDRGYYAEVRVTTTACLQAVSQKLQGNPDILSAKGRQLIVNYKTAVQPPVPLIEG